MIYNIIWFIYITVPLPSTVSIGISIAPLQVAIRFYLHFFWTFDRIRVQHQTRNIEHCVNLHNDKVFKLFCPPLATSILQYCHSPKGQNSKQLNKVLSWTTHIQSCISFKILFHAKAISVGLLVLLSFLFLFWTGHRPDYNGN